jgi:hypothetical protein
MDATTLFAGVILGSLGMGYIVYGRKQKKGIALLSGLILSGLPWFVSNVYFLLIAGIAFAVLPFLVRY